MTLLNTGACLRISGIVTKTILLPLKKHPCIPDTEPSRCVTVIFVICRFIESSASTSFPR